ncbi:hypothetical protein [Ornithinimicrobium sp. INDO-MA30-4]|uniref:hypothetical protein n=1 Tax=Ornithinimicrobium sp. INDO-MA30-4 TaxID=2908651 RepID=UPI001F165A6D|nr:hypothetical protein [Ornithinimicrobium sp. INDO-MA30-4]UJH70307.1 hypothetical protein L0A91_14375 [Ornithinimicrobium sp. INDO-MA30-4]
MERGRSSDFHALFSMRLQAATERRAVHRLSTSADGALTVALVSGPAVTMPVVVLCVVGAISVLYAALPQRRLVVVCAFVTLLVGVSQVAPYAVYLPRWLTIALVGGALLALGIRYERNPRG